MKKPITCRTWYRFDEAKAAARKALGARAKDACAFGARFGVWWMTAPKGHHFYKDSVQGASLTQLFVDKYGLAKRNPVVNARPKHAAAGKVRTIVVNPHKAARGAQAQLRQLYLFNVADYTGGLAP
jgi:hypothetical protein